jgi:hypothetical protein
MRSRSSRGSERRSEKADSSLEEWTEDVGLIEDRRGWAGAGVNGASSIVVSEESLLGDVERDREPGVGVRDAMARLLVLFRLSSDEGRV